MRIDNPPKARTYVLPGEKSKDAYLWIALLDGSFFGADLYFSSVKAFEKLHNPLKPEEGFLLPVKVPVDFDQWDFIPDNY